MRRPLLPVLALLVATTVLPSARAQTGTVAQTGRAADEVRQTLAGIRLPPGFRIDLFAMAPGARQLAVSPGGEAVMVGTRRTTVWRVSRPDAGGAAEVRPFAPSADFRDPNGVCWTRDGTLVVAERNRVRRFAAAASTPDPAGVDIVAAGNLVPPDEESGGHGARVCRVGPDEKLYITIGEPYNVQPAEKVAKYRELGIGGIVRMKQDGSQREVFATGIRNSVGLDFDPRDGALWFTDNQTDGLGDTQPPGELNRATKPGQDFGYPYWNGHVKVAGSVAAPDLKNLPEPAGAVFPQAEFPAHQAQLGMAFYRGTMFPERYHGGVFVAAHGSWNSSVPTGALVDFVPIRPDGSAGKPEVFAEGWNDHGEYRGRPVDVATLPDGSLLVSDDQAGAVYRISYTGR